MLARLRVNGSNPLWYYLQMNISSLFPTPNFPTMIIRTQVAWF
jgi:hypothetical protein